LSTLPIAARACRVRNPGNGALAELDANQHAALAACEGIRTLDEHAKVIRANLGVRDEDVPVIQSWLRDFAAQGLLVAEDAMVRRLGADHDIEPVPVAGIVVRTCDRPALLARVLESAAAMAARYDRRDRYFVLDDSRDPASRAANRQCL